MGSTGLTGDDSGRRVPASGLIRTRSSDAGGDGDGPVPPQQRLRQARQPTRPGPARRPGYLLAAL